MCAVLVIKNKILEYMDVKLLTFIFQYTEQLACWNSIHTQISFKGLRLKQRQKGICFTGNQELYCTLRFPCGKGVNERMIPVALICFSTCHWKTGEFFIHEELCDNNLVNFKASQDCSLHWSLLYIPSNRKKNNSFHYCNSRLLSAVRS